MCFRALISDAALYYHRRNLFQIERVIPYIMEFAEFTSSLLTNEATTGTTPSIDPNSLRILSQVKWLWQSLTLGSHRTIISSSLVWIHAYVCVHTLSHYGYLGAWQNCTEEPFTQWWRERVTRHSPRANRRSTPSGFYLTERHPKPNKHSRDGGG